MTLEMKGIYKSFGANDVLRDVSFTLNGGEICTPRSVRTAIPNSAI